MFDHLRGSGCRHRHYRCGWRIGGVGGRNTFVIGVLDKVVKRIIEIHGPGKVHDGDMFITNDPYSGGVTHLNDVVVAMPEYADGKLIAWTASGTHWNDTGGIVAGAMSADVSEVFQEGLRLPAVRLFDRGEQVATVLDIILANSGLPKFVSGNLWAQIAASRRAGNRLVQIRATYGHLVYVPAVEALFDAGEARTRAWLGNLPNGRLSI